MALAEDQMEVALVEDRCSCSRILEDQLSEYLQYPRAVESYIHSVCLTHYASVSRPAAMSTPAAKRGDLVGDSPHRIQVAEGRVYWHDLIAGTSEIQKNSCPIDWRAAWASVIPRYIPGQNSVGDRF